MLPVWPVGAAFDGEIEDEDGGERPAVTQAPASSSPPTALS